MTFKILLYIPKFLMPLMKYKNPTTLALIHLHIRIWISLHFTLDTVHFFIRFLPLVHGTLSMLSDPTTMHSTFMQDVSYCVWWNCHSSLVCYCFCQCWGTSSTILLNFSQNNFLIMRWKLKAMAWTIREHKTIFFYFCIIFATVFWFNNSNLLIFMYPCSFLHIEIILFPKSQDNSLLYGAIVINKFKWFNGFSNMSITFVW